MSAAIYPIRIEQGATFERAFRWTAGGLPVDLSAVTFKMQVRAQRSLTATLLWEGTSLDGHIVVTNAADGRFRVTVFNYETTPLEPGPGFYDLLATMGDSSVRRLLEGSVIIAAGVTSG